MKTIVGITEELTFNELSKLDSFVMLYNHILHELYVDLFIKKLSIKELCPLYQTKYLISKRHFDSIQKLLEGKVRSILALNKNYLIDTQDKIKETEKELKYQHKSHEVYKTLLVDNKLTEKESQLKYKLQNKIKYNQQRLDRLKSKLVKLEQIKETGNVHLCFGSNKLFRQQFLIDKPNNLTQFKTHDDWYKEFNYQRNKEFTLIGSKDETVGNCNAQIKHIENNVFELKININHKANKVIDKYVKIKFTVNYEIEILKQIIANNNGKDKDLWQALTYKLTKQRDNNKHNKNKYLVSISFEKNLIKKTYTSKPKYNGVIGVDVNQDHLAVVNLDVKGNLLDIYTYEYSLNGTQHQNNNSISLAVKELMLLATQLNKPIVIEQLDFTNKKKELKSSVNKYIKTRNKQLSSFAYSKIIELIKARAEDNYVEVKEVNPAYTSLIGSIKYAQRNRISVHHAAAMCIGRKGLFNKEFFVKALNKKTNEEYNRKVIKEHVEKRISSKNRYVNSLNLPARNNLSLSIYWKELKETIVKQQLHLKKNSIKPVESSTSLNDNY